MLYLVSSWWFCNTLANCKCTCIFSSYLKKCLLKSPCPPPPPLQGQLAGPESLLFSPGMRVEAKDTTKPSVMCVATIKEVSRRKVLVHYDGWGEEWNFWCDAGSTDIHPPMWSGKNGKTVTPPLGKQFIIQVTF